MTSLAFIFGVVPLVIATGAGAEMRQSLGATVFFGMAGVTAFGLIFTPVFYVACRSLERFGKGGSFKAPRGFSAQVAQDSRTDEVLARRG